VLKKTITYKNFDGESVTKDFYFNLNKAEIVELGLSEGGNLADRLRGVVAAGEQEEIMRTFKMLLEMSVGVRDGDQFDKSPKAKGSFMNTDAFSEFFMELVTDAGKAVEFIRGVMPQDIREDVERRMAEEGSIPSGWVPKVVDLPAEDVKPIEPPKKTLEEYTRAELHEMSEDDFYELVGRDAKKWNKAVLAIAMARKAGE
jgi:hypothetical protein